VRAREAVTGPGKFAWARTTLTEFADELLEQLLAIVEENQEVAPEQVY
jgi:hypothetical protein